MPRAGAIGLALAALAAAGTSIYLSLWWDDTISIRVRGVDVTVSEGTTLAEAAERFGLAPSAGDLLDVQGGVLRGNAFPGELFLNGRAALPARELEDGDRVRGSGPPRPARARGAHLRPRSGGDAGEPAVHPRSGTREE